MKYLRYALCIGLLGAFTASPGGELPFPAPLELQKTQLLSPEKDNARNSEGSFVALSDGRILFAYSGYVAGAIGDDSAANILARSSADGGRTWSQSDRLLVARGEKERNVMSVSLLRLANGDIAMVYLCKQDLIPGVPDCRPRMRISQDEGETWSEARQIIPTPGYYVVNNDRLIQLRDGRLILPASFHRYRQWPNGEISINPRGIGLVYFSDDNGQTWKEAGDWLLPPDGRMISGLQEPGVVELSDGRLWMWFRTGSGAQYTCESVDRGETWSSPTRSADFPSAESPMAVKRNPESGELIAIWNDYSTRWNVEKLPTSWGRTPLVMACSDDDGKSWKNHVLLEGTPGHGYCYTSMFFHDGDLLLAYNCGGVDWEVLQQLQLARIPMRQDAERR